MMITLLKNIRPREPQGSGPAESPELVEEVEGTVWGEEIEGKPHAKLMRNPLVVARVAELQKKGDAQRFSRFRTRTRIPVHHVHEKNVKVWENIPATQGCMYTEIRENCVGNIPSVAINPKKDN